MEERKNITIGGVLVGLVIGIAFFLGFYLLTNKDLSFKSKKDDNVSNNNGTSNVVENATVSIKEDDTKEYVYDAEYNNHNMPSGYVKGASNDNSKRISNDIFNSLQADPSDPQSFDNMKVPYINIKGAQPINKMLEYNYLDSVQEFVYYTSNIDEPHPTRTVLTYYTYTSNDILSVVIVSGNAQTSPIGVGYLVFNYDLKTGKLLSNDELIQKLGIIDLDDKVKEKITNYIENEYLSDSRHSRTFNTGDGEISVVDYNINEYLNSSKDRMMYIDNDGNLNVILFLETGAQLQLRKSFVVSK